MKVLYLFLALLFLGLPEALASETLTCPPLAYASHRARMEQADAVIVIKATSEKAEDWGYKATVVETLKGELKYDASGLLVVGEQYVSGEEYAGKEMHHIRYLMEDGGGSYYDYGRQLTVFEGGSNEMTRIHELAAIIRSGNRSTYNLSLLKWHLKNWKDDVLAVDAIIELEDNWAVTKPDMSSINSQSYQYDDIISQGTYFTWDIADAEARELAQKVFEKHSDYSYPLAKALIEYGVQSLNVCNRLLEIRYQSDLERCATKKLTDDGSGLTLEIDNFYFGDQWYFLVDDTMFPRIPMSYISEQKLLVFLQDQLPANCLERSFFERLLLFEIKMASLSTQTRLGLNHLADISWLSESVGEAELTAGHYQLANLVEMAVGSLDANDWAPEAYDKLPKIDGLHAFDEFISVSQQYVDMCSDPRIRILTGKRMLWDCSDESAFAKAEAFEAGTIEVKAYPNPSNGQFTIRAKVAKDESIKLRVFDMMGQEIVTRDLEKLMAEGDPTYSLSIDITGQPMGIYLITLTQGNKVHQERVSLVK